MAEPDLFLWVATLVGASLGTLLTYIVCQRKLHHLKEQLTAYQVQRHAQQRALEDRETLFDQAMDHLAATFSDLSTRALSHNSETFLQLAGENFDKHRYRAVADLEQKEHAVANLLKPVREALQKTEVTLQQLDKDRKETWGALRNQLESMTASHNQLQAETRNLVTALRRPEVRGRWGELTLKRLVELAGMVDHCDFQEQINIDTESGRQRPDMVIRLPEDREIVVDVKTPLDAYLSAIEADTDEQRQAHLERHARHMRDRVRELAGKRYWEQFDNAPDFVVLFIPGEQFLSAAFDVDDKLLEDALQQHVIIATPTSFVALLRAVAYGWRQLEVAANAKIIGKLGEDLFKRLSTFTEHLATVGKSLGNSVDAYNRAVGSLDRNVLPGARKFTELGLKPGKPLADLEPLEKAPREPSGA